MPGRIPDVFLCFGFQKDRLENVGAVGGLSFGLPTGKAHRLYNSLLLRHKPWLVQRFACDRGRLESSWEDTVVRRISDKTCQANSAQWLAGNDLLEMNTAYHWLNPTQWCRGRRGGDNYLPEISACQKCSCCRNILEQKYNILDWICPLRDNSGAQLKFQTPIYVVCRKFGAVRWKTATPSRPSQP